MLRCARRSLLSLMGSSVLFLAGPLSAQVTFDGTLDFSPTGEWGAAELVALQSNYTGFGDQSPGGTFPGSEIDALFAQSDSVSQTVYLGLTGNVSTDNLILILLDTKEGGLNALSGVNTTQPGFGLRNMEGDVLEAGFFPDYAIQINVSGGTAYVDWYELTSSPTSAYRGAIDLNTGDNTLEGGAADGLVLAMNNTNVLGVTASSAADATTATTGIEAAIPFALLSIPTPLPQPAPVIKVQAVVVSKTGYLSNHSLPTLDPILNPANLGFPVVNFDALARVQAADIPLVDQPWTGTIDGANIPADFTGLGNPVAIQLNPAGFGDQLPGNLSRGSELDQLLAQDDTVTLQIGITGNLNFNGDNLVIFLDTVPEAGQNVLSGNGGRLGGNNGDTLPCTADYAILANIYLGTQYVDFFDLGAQTSAYLGSNQVNGTNAALQGGSGGDWQMILHSDNILGVSGNAAHDPQELNAATATTGWEISIPLSAIGSPAPGQQIGILAMITGSGDDRYISNQILPALGGGNQPNLGNGPSGTGVDLASLGYQCGLLTIGTPPPLCPSPRFRADDDEDVDMVDFARFQVCYTGSATAPLTLADECKCFDWDTYGLSDGRIDEADLEMFLRCAATSGPGVVADPACDQPLPPQ